MARTLVVLSSSVVSPTHHLLPFDAVFVHFVTTVLPRSGKGVDESERSEGTGASLAPMGHLGPLRPSWGLL
jgi:hypothetical protein